MKDSELETRSDATPLGRRGALRLLALGATGALVAACGTSCQGQSGAAAQGCQARITEFRQRRFNSLPGNVL